MWSGEQLTLEEIKAVFGPAYQDIDDVQQHLQTLGKWLHINRTSASGFELINRTTIEMGMKLSRYCSKLNLSSAFARIFSYWPHLDIILKNVFIEDKVQAQCIMHMIWPDRHTVESYFADIYKFEPNLARL